MFRTFVSNLWFLLITSDVCLFGLLIFDILMDDIFNVGSFEMMWMILPFDMSSCECTYL